MREEEVVIANFSRDVTTSDLGAALSLSNTLINHLRAVFENLVPDTAPLPETEVPLRDAYSETHKPHIRGSHSVLRPSSPSSPTPPRSGSRTSTRQKSCVGAQNIASGVTRRRHTSTRTATSSASSGRCKVAPDHSKLERKGDIRAPKSTSPRQHSLPPFAPDDLETRIQRQIPLP